MNKSDEIFKELTRAIRDCVRKCGDCVYCKSGKGLTICIRKNSKEDMKLKVSPFVYSRFYVEKDEMACEYWISRKEVELANRSF